MSLKRIVMPIFESSIHMITTKEEAREFIAIHSDAADDYSEWVNFCGFAHEITDKSGVTRHVLCVFDGTLNTTVHECTHMAQKKMKHLNLKQKPEDDEILAYFTAWLVEEMLRLINEDKEKVA